MKRYIVILGVACLIAISLSHEQRIYGDNMNKMNLSNSDQENIKELAGNYLKKLTSFANESELRGFYAKELWATGGEGLELKIIEGFSFKKMITRKDDEFGIFVRLPIGFRVISEVSENGYREIRENQNRILGFIFENNNWKIKSIFSSVYFSKEGALKWAQRFKNSKNDEYAKVAELILNNLK